MRWHITSSVPSSCHEMPASARAFTVMSTTYPHNHQINLCTRHSPKGPRAVPSRHLSPMVITPPLRAPSQRQEKYSTPNRMLPMRLPLFKVQYDALALYVAATPNEPQALLHELAEHLIGRAACRPWTTSPSPPLLDAADAAPRSSRPISSERVAAPAAEPNRALAKRTRQDPSALLTSAELHAPRARQRPSNPPRQRRRSRNQTCRTPAQAGYQ